MGVRPSGCVEVDGCCDMASRQDHHAADPARAGTRLGRRPRGRRAGITLLEVLLALMLVTFLLVLLFEFSQSTMQADQRSRELATRSRLARVVLDRMANEVRQAASFGRSVSGDENSIRVLSFVLPERDLFERRKIQEGPRSLQTDLTEVHYYLKIFEDEYEETDEGVEVPAVAGLFRREWRILNHDDRSSLTQGISSLPRAVRITVGYKPIELEPIEEQTDDSFVEVNPGTEEHLAPEIKCLKLRYHDGKNWVRRWAYREEQTGKTDQEGQEGQETQPKASVQVQYDQEEEEEKEEHPDRYTMTVFLYQSDWTGVGPKLTRIMDEMYEQFGGAEGIPGMEGLSGLTGGGVEGLLKGGGGDANSLGLPKGANPSQLMDMFKKMGGKI